MVGQVGSRDSTNHGFCFRSIMQDEVDDHMDAALVRLRKQLLEVIQRAVLRVHGVEIAYIITVFRWTIHDGHEPDSVDAEVGGGGRSPSLR